MKQTFKGSLMTLGAMMIISAFLFAVGVVTPESSAIYNAALGAVVFMMCSSPLVMLVAIVSGIATLVNQGQGKAKRKREFTDFGFDNDQRLEDIMQRLSPEQQIYLENKLRNNRLGVNTDDGELMSLDDLLDDFDSKEKRM